MTEDAIGPGELARLQQQVLAAALSGRTLEPGGASLSLPDLQFARRGQEVALSRANLAEPLDLTALPQIRLTTAATADRRGAAAGYLEFTPPKVEGEQLTLTLQVRAPPPGGTATIPLSAVTLRFERRGGEWVMAAPPAALST
jgi:hypothetical protein